MVKISTINFIMLFIFSLNKYYCNIICQSCKNEISYIENIIEIKSHIAINSKRKKLFNKNNVFSQVFINPQNVYFEIITTNKSVNLVCDSESYSQETFFLGYSWSICNCLYCGTHHGWKFTPIKDYCTDINDNKEKEVCLKRREFYGLVTTHLESAYKIIERIEL